MVTWIIITMASTLLGQFVIDKEGVRIQVDVRANVYTYKVTNLIAPPIVHFEVQQCNSYLFQAPEGWEFDKDTQVFSARTVDENSAIHPGETGQFSLRVGRKGAILGLVQAKLEFDSVAEIATMKVWGPIREPRGVVFLVVGVTIAIILVHTLLLRYRDRRQQSVNNEK